MADSNIQTPDTVKPITLDEYQERTAHLQENTTSLLSTIADRQVQSAGLATQAYSLASEVNAVAEQASLSFSKKTWEDNATSGTPITAAELNRLENAISNLTTAVNNLQDSVSRVLARPGITFSGTVAVPGLKNRASVIVAFGRGQHAIMPTADGTHMVSGVAAGRDASVVTALATATVSGEQVTFSNVTFNMLRASSLGSALTFVAGDKEMITAIYG